MVYRLYHQSKRKTAYLRVTSVWVQGNAGGDWEWTPAIFEAKSTANKYAKRLERESGRRVMVLKEEA